MSKLVRNIGATANTDSAYNGRCAFTLSNGNALVVVRDANSAGATNGDHSGQAKFYIFESTDRVTFTLRATVTATTTLVGQYTAALFADNSIGILSSSADNIALYYAKVTYSTWAVSAWEALPAASADVTNGTYRRIDMCITDTNVPIVVAYKVSSSASIKNATILVRRTSDNTWIKTNNTTGIAQNQYSAGGAAISVCAPSGTATARNVVLAWGDSDPNSSNDYGVKLFTQTINESTGAVTGITQRATYCIGEALGGNSTVRTNGEGRQVKLFNTGSTSEFTLGIAHNEVNRHFFVMRGSWNGTTFSTTVPLGYSYTSEPASLLGDCGLGITASNDVVTFHYSNRDGNNTNHNQIISYPCRINRTTNTIKFPAVRGWWTDAAPASSSTTQIWGGGDRNFSIAKHDTLLYVYASSTSIHVDHMYSYPGTVLPITSTPASGATVTTSTPSLLVRADTDRVLSQAYDKIIWQFAKDSLFTTNLVTYLQDDSRFASVTGTNVAGVTVSFTDTLPSSYALTQGTWYLRAALVDQNDQQGPWSTVHTFSVSHPPAATALTPGGSTQYGYGNGQRTFTWKTTDAFAGDSQTAFQLLLQRNDTGATILDTGKITSTSPSTTQTIPATYKDTMLQWCVRAWDEDDVAGPYSAYNLFKVADAPTVVLVSPTSGSTISSGVPSVQFTPSVGGGRTIKSYTVSILQGQTTIWTVTKTNLNIASGTTVTETATKSYLKNNQSYTVQVTVTDSTGLSGSAPATVFTTLWVTPAAPTGLAVDGSQYNVEDQGYITVSWSDTGRDADFSGWYIYRRDNLIDSRTGAIIETGQWNLIYVEFNTGVTYTYRDYLAPSGYQVDYRVTQSVNRFGDIVESSNTNFASIVPVSDGYWLVTPAAGDVTASAFRLSYVTSDSYTDEYESETYNVIGRGRHVDLGQRLGWAGSLEAQIRDSTTSTARQKKKRIDLIKSTSAVLWLRNPFGDSLPVSVGDIAVSRIAGVGASEFCDVTIPYAEVGL